MALRRSAFELHPHLLILDVRPGIEPGHDRVAAGSVPISPAHHVSFIPGSADHQLFRSCLLAGAVGIEPTFSGLESDALPLDDAPELVEPAGTAPASPACKAGVLLVELRSHIIRFDGFVW